MYLKQTMFLGYIVLQLFCIYNCAMCNVILNVKYVLYLLLLLFNINAVSKFEEQTEYNVHDRDFLESWFNSIIEDIPYLQDTDI